MRETGFIEAWSPSATRPCREADRASTFAPARKHEGIGASWILRLLFVLALLVLPVLPADAHRSNESYVYFDVTDDSLSGRFEFKLSDLDVVLDLDSDGNGTVETTEFLAASDEVFSYMSERLTITHEGRTLTIVPGVVETLDAGSVGVFGKIGFEVTGLAEIPQTLEVHYRPLTDITADHGGYILIGSNTRVGLEENEAYVSLTFSDGDGPKTLSLVGEPWLTVFRDFVVHGIWHIWLGFDHVVFLLTLLLPSAMLASGRTWVASDDFGSAFWTVAKVVTVFTLSHSVTLVLAGLGLVQVPVGIVEAIIAASIIAVALMNLFPAAHKHILLVVFVFGLFHGFGFANALESLALDPSRKVLGILAFNVGVEIGQLAIVCLIFPLIWVLRDWTVYRFLAFRVGTVALVAVAGIWFLERTTEFEFDARGAIAAVSGIEL